MARGNAQFKLNLPDEVLGRVKVAAARSGRSITAEIVHCLEDAYSRSAKRETVARAVGLAAIEAMVRFNDR